MSYGLRLRYTGLDTEPYQPVRLLRITVPLLLQSVPTLSGDELVYYTLLLRLGI